MNEESKGKKNYLDWSAWSCFLLLGVIPLVAINFLNPAWVGRLVATIGFNLGLPMFFVWLYLHPDDLLKDYRAKDKVKDQMAYNAPTNKWKPIAKGFCLLVIGFFLFNDGPLIQDIFGLMNGPSPLQTKRAKVSANEAGLPLLWWTHQGILFSGDTQNTYDLVYSWEFIHPNREYEFTFLKNSKVIVDFR